MKLLAFCAYDRAVEAYLPPFFVRHRGEALRSFMDACNDPNHQFSKHVLDYTLVYVGEFDDQSGRLVPELDVVRVISATECLADRGGAEVQVASPPADRAGRVPAFSNSTKVG